MNTSKLWLRINTSSCVTAEGGGMTKTSIHRTFGDILHYLLHHPLPSPTQGSGQ
eukprot:gnl/Chilomastix_caulleri/7435.p1 GENE.gnl/Chilomastix_caulleri/7435~~gnl/Chilomastix_caulleri/7435.p1  ORF type:complete len:54 (+),score=9.68 gnl/Chilomastix_caulleri/7435:49-210(+)